MATIKIPLNKFISKQVKLTSSPDPLNIYLAPERRASIIIFSQVSNQTSATRTFTIGVSTGNEFYPFVSNLDIPPFDARSVVSGRAVIRGVDNIDIFEPDLLVVRDSTSDTFTPFTSGAGLTGLTISLGILETINVD